MLGDFAAGATVTARFNTQGPTGAPITLAGTPAARVRKGSGAGTTSTAGVTLTVDVVTGQHVVDVDTSADGTFYASGSEFSIELSAGTVSGVSVAGAVLETFSIAHRADPAGVTTLTGRLTSTRAGLLDNLDAAVSTRSTFAGGPVASVTGNVGGNVVGSVGSLGTQAKADVNAEVDTAISDAALATAANLATVDTVADAIKAKTDNLPASPAATADIPTAGENAVALLDLADAIETGLTLRQAQRLQVAAAAGRVSGAATTAITIRDVADTKDRIVATVDAAGNRSAITTNLT
jgi:hypothetical protein